MTAADAKETAYNAAPKGTGDDAAQRVRLGIMGGGQLGLFLCRSARQLGVQTTVMEANSRGSALHAADRALLAALDDQEALEQLIQASDVITFELEAIPDESLDRLRQAEAAGRVRVRPSPDTLALFKDKGVQKAWLTEEGLPTLPYLTVESGKLPEAFNTASWSFPLVQKAHRGGYDGKGVQLLRDASATEELWNTPSYIEPALHPLREIGVVVARGESGELLAYPPVSMAFDERYNSVYSVTSPGEFSDALRAKAEALALRAIGALDSPGVFAVELFVETDALGEEQVTINEISPRVHNSGHLTIEAFRHSQFDQHVRAIMGRTLAPIEPLADAAVMLNLLYEPALDSACPDRPRTLQLPDREDSEVLVHWYGKSTGQLGRKMGHLTALAGTAAQAQQAAEAALMKLKHWRDYAATVREIKE